MEGTALPGAPQWEWYAVGACRVPLVDGNQTSLVRMSGRRALREVFAPYSSLPGPTTPQRVAHRKQGP